MACPDLDNLGPVLRLARTTPREGAPGAGLPCYYLSNLSKRQTLILTKKAEGRLLEYGPNVSVVEFEYRDLTIKQERLSKIRLMIIGSSKLWGEINILLVAFREIKKREFRPSIIHIHSANYLISGLIISKLMKAKVFLSLGGTEVKRFHKNVFFRFLLRRVDGLLAVSDSMRSLLEPMAKCDNIVFTGNGVDKNIFFRDTAIARGNTIVAVGNLRWQKNYKTLINAFSELADEGFDWKLKIYGEGPDRADLEQLILTNDMRGRITLAGTQAQSHVADALRECGIYVLSSVSEGFPKSLLEAMSCGAPVVATDVGECPSLLKGIADCVPAHGTAALRQQLRSLMVSPEIRRKLGDACYEESLGYSWEKMAERIENEYQGLNS